ncbi:transcriptional regulator [Nitrososphaera sp.]|uniref:helix-turn-helix transcriptional regulator n=1 Tax=Nitrososphaera sp. TaxID=1971748 RepID=UPI002EDB52B8
MPARDADESVSAYVDTEKTFFELASEQRLSIIFRISEKKAKISQLAKDLGITIQEAHRNVKRLQDAGLIEKNPEGVFSLTTYGSTIIKQIPTFNYLSKHKEYFSEHVLGELPIKFIMRLGALDKCEYVKGVVAILERWKGIYRNADQYVYEIVPQVPIDLIEPAIDRVKSKGIKYSYVLPKNVIIPKGRKDLLKKLGHNELLNKGAIERRMVDSVQVAVVLNEKHASVMFPTPKGETDMNMLFYSSDPIFHEWCLDYFRYRWYGSDIFDENRLKEI